MLELIDQLGQIKSAKFASFTYTAKKSGEKARHTLLLGVSIESVYKQDVKTLEAMMPKLSGIELQAAQEIHSSLCVSLAGGIGNNPAATSANAYTHVDEFSNVKVHNETGDIHIMGLSVAKVVLTKGTYPTVKSGPLKIAKNAIDELLRRGKIRQYALTNIGSARLNGETIELE